jgi:hypothetical protein
LMASHMAAHASGKHTRCISRQANKHSCQWQALWEPHFSAATHFNPISMLRYCSTTCIYACIQLLAQLRPAGRACQPCCY